MSSSIICGYRWYSSYVTLFLVSRVAVTNDPPLPQMVCPVSLHDSWVFSSKRRQWSIAKSPSMPRTYAREGGPCAAIICPSAMRVVTPGVHKYSFICLCWSLIVPLGFLSSLLLCLSHRTNGDWDRPVDLLLQP